MFDILKLIVGLQTCAGCRYRRWGGLFCGKRVPFSHFRPTPWGRYGCWHYASGRIGRAQQIELRILRRKRT